MVKRNHVEQVLEVKAREGRRRPPGEHQLEALRRLWASKPAQLAAVSDFFPMRIVTIIEVFTRGWIERLIDHGSPYLEHGAELLRDMKLDYAVAMAIQGRKVSLGGLVAHTVSINSIEQLAHCFDQVLGEKFFQAVGQTYDRFAVERTGAPKVPIIADLPSTQSTLARLFEARHIVTHELPKAPPFSGEDVDAFLSAATEFVRATDEMLNNRVHPNYPLTTREMVEDAGRTRQAATEQMEAMLPRVTEFTAAFDADLAGKCQEAWTAYRDLQAKLRGCHLKGGSLQPLVELREATRVAKARMDDLRWWADRGEGDI